MPYCHRTRPCEFELAPPLLPSAVWTLEVAQRLVPKVSLIAVKVEVAYVVMQPTARVEVALFVVVWVILPLGPIVVVAVPPKKAVLFTDITVVEARPEMRFPIALTAPVRVLAPVTERVPSVAMLVLIVVAAWTRPVTKRTENTTERTTATGPF